MTPTGKATDIKQVTAKLKIATDSKQVTAKLKIVDQWHQEEKQQIVNKSQPN